jgi:hypothetical protein
MQITLSLSETVYFPARLPWQLGTSLVLRRLLLGPRRMRRGQNLVARRQNGRRNANEYAYTGVIFGVTLGNLAHYCRGSKHRLYKIMREIRKALEPVASRVCRMHGEDKRVLSLGMASHRVMASQLKKLHELKRAPPIDSKMGHHGVVLGVTAAILVVFSVFAADSDDIVFGTGVSGQLSTCLFQAADALRVWRFPDSTEDDDIKESLCAERRAIQRAIAGVRRAGTLARKHNLNYFDQFKLELKLYAMAAWPSNRVINEESHDAMMEVLIAGAGFDLDDVKAYDDDFFAPPPGVVPLSALPNLLCMNRDTGNGSDLESVSCSSASSISSSISGPATPVSDRIRSVVVASPVPTSPMDTDPHRLGPITP